MPTKTTLIEQLDPLRGNDLYPSQEIKDQLIQLYLPASVSDLALNLSNITSQFYALLLQSIGAKYGVAAVQEHSETLFHHLGKVKAEQALLKDPSMHRDCRSLILVVISAIYTSSPEYTFTIKKFTADESIISLAGIDRYHRAAKQFGIDTMLSFPTLLSFMHGIKDYLELTDVEITASDTSYDANSNVTNTYTFKKQPR
ncbi:hypothetical protein [Myroides odoratus]|uniref:hypothetical protein n=1 Tax=Myroides odoratus TaxID=256 RepID=UPI00076618B5|nr:hypothetical protein [Myroides odoratus]